jgi:hypothetical protein
MLNVEGTVIHVMSSLSAIFCGADFANRLPNITGAVLM